MSSSTETQPGARVIFVPPPAYYAAGLVGGLAINLGLALVFGSWWPLLLAMPVIIAVRQLVIRPEEQYLAERFGPAFTDNRSRVRRWP